MFAKKLSRRIVFAAAVALGGLSLPWSSAPTLGVGVALVDEPAAAKLPSGEEILDAYVKATGGADAYTKLENRTSTGSVDIPAVGIKGSIVTVQAAPNKARITMDLPGVGKSEQGTDGETVWEKNPVTGVRILEGAERDMMLRQLRFNAELNWKESYKSAETVTVEDVEGKPAYKVKLTAHDGSVTHNYYDKESGLLLKSDSIYKSQMGDMPISVLVGEYKEVDGIKMPMLATQTLQGMQMKLVTESVQHNTTLAADAFELPEEVKALKAKAAGTPGN